MNHSGNYSDDKLIELQEVCKELCCNREIHPVRLLDIATIALVEINRELDARKIRKEITK